ncbi:Bug family tripartite tricarboxylate transporter substrate binding protein [Cupriavidus sp. CP313]
MTTPATASRRPVPSMAFRKRRAALLGSALWLCLAGSAPLPALAQGFPGKTMTLVVGYPPGGSNDIAARIIAPKLGALLGTTVVVENRAGANAVIGASYVARAVPDGNTLLVASASPLVIAPHTFTKVPYDTLKDFAPISLLAVVPEVLAVNPSVPATSAKDLLALSKTRQMRLASSGNGGMPHLAIEQIRGLGQGNLLHVPYKGASPAVMDTVAGHVDGVVMDLPPVYSLIQEGKLRALVVTARQRTEALPNVPAAAEAGMGTVIAENWIGLFAPAKAPKPVLDKLFTAMQAVARDPEVKAQLKRAAMTPGTSESPQAFAGLVKDEHARWGEIAKRANIVPE